MDRQEHPTGTRCVCPTRAFEIALAVADVKHHYIRSRRPQTNGASRMGNRYACLRSDAIDYDTANAIWSIERYLHFKSDLGNPLWDTALTYTIRDDSVFVTWITISIDP